MLRIAGLLRHSLIENIEVEIDNECGVHFM